MSESVQRESEQVVNEGWKVVSIYFLFFIGIYGVRKVQCYVSVQVSILKFILVLK